MQQIQIHHRQRPPDDCRVRHGSLGQGGLRQPTILVAESSADTQSWLGSVASEAFPNGWIITASSVQEALEALRLHAVDIALVDFDLPDGSGIDVIHESFRTSPLTRCVVTTTYDDDDHIAPALAAGALGYLLKDQAETVLIQQLRLLADGIPPLAPSIARRLVRHFAEEHMSAAPPPVRKHEDDLTNLSQRERQVMSLIAKGMQIIEVAQLLEITTNTVCSHVKSIYRKRNVSSRAEAALEARRLGLV